MEPLICTASTVGPTPLDSPSSVARLEAAAAARRAAASRGGLRIFLKFRTEVKKVDNAPNSLAALRSLFVDKFPEIKDKACFAVYVQHSTAHVWYEAERMEDVYHNAVLEAREKDAPSPKDLYLKDRSSSRRIDTGLFTDRMVFILVGLPARGKTYIGGKVCRYLNWLDLPTRVFNVGNYRRTKLGAKQDVNFFNPENEMGRTARLHMAVLALDDMFDWLGKGGRIGIFDATNTTKDRRQLLKSRCDDEGVQAVFIESICEDPAIIASNLKQVKASSPDFEGLPPEEAVQLFSHRVKLYEKAYQTIDKEEGLAYIKLFDVGRKIELENLPSSYLMGKIVFFLMNLHIIPRPIFLTRHGQSQDNENERLGGDSSLTTMGDKYAQALAGWISNRITPTNEDGTKRPAHLTVWTSTLIRAITTSQYIPKRKLHLKALDEIDAGLCTGMTYDEIAEKMPEEFAARAADKLRYRYPQGESYEDVIQRLEPIIFELERQREPVLIIAHNAVIRCLYAYFADKVPEDCPHLTIPLHTIIEITPKAYACEEKRFNLLQLSVPTPPSTRTDTTPASSSNQDATARASGGAAADSEIDPALGRPFD
eukprot:TRINITY_DN1625_c0_g1_i7.p1 TRINITY_DN1625_c0_g1~~TRINITY_DN1625_c0_g1_i7.p1  ORF type:complete len:596 (-),score=117.68 TRINITY_DN1625_c0_g1_i7:32-1819(-)